MQTIDQEKFQKIADKIQELKKSGKFDLSMEEDLSLAIMNLVSLEEHFFFTGEKTKKGEYFEMLTEIREMRKSLLAKMIDRHEGETWCISKHLLAATMRLMEVATKLQADGKKPEAKGMFDKAYHLYALFWGIRLKLVQIDNIKAVPEDMLNKHDKTGSKQPWTMEDILNKLVNCCNE